jgi:hypothetical protein
MLFSEAKAIEKKKYWQDRELVGNGDNGRELWKQRTMCKVIGAVKEIAWSHDGIPEMKLLWCSVTQADMWDPCPLRISRLEVSKTNVVY